MFDTFDSVKGIIKVSHNRSSVSKDHVLKIIKSISPNKATGLDSLPAKFIRDAATEIVSPLTHNINLSLFHGAVSAELKSARLVPLYKKSSKTEVGNYRPVSILSVV